MQGSENSPTYPWEIMSGLVRYCYNFTFYPLEKSAV